MVWESGGGTRALATWIHFTSRLTCDADFWGVLGAGADLFMNMAASINTTEVQGRKVANYLGGYIRDGDTATFFQSPHCQMRLRIVLAFKYRCGCTRQQVHSVCILNHHVVCSLAARCCPANHLCNHENDSARAWNKHPIVHAGMVKAFSGLNPRHRASYWVDKCMRTINYGILHWPIMYYPLMQNRNRPPRPSNEYSTWSSWWTDAWRASETSRRRWKRIWLRRDTSLTKRLIWFVGDHTFGHRVRAAFNHFPFGRHNCVHPIAHC